MPPRYPTPYGPQRPYNPGYQQQRPYYPPPQQRPVPMQTQPVLVQQQPQPTLVVQQVAPTAAAKPVNVLEYLTKHPVAPLAGALLWGISQFTDEPVPPTVPSGLPDQLKAQWQMVYSQNQQKFQRRMALFEKLGEVLLGYSGVNTVLDAIQRNKSA